jgi:CRP-like cAMP-binding protein
MQESLETLRSLVFTIHPLSEDDWQSLSAIWKPVRTGRKELLTSLGEKEKYLYFVLDGVQRIYYLDDLGREATLAFTYAPSFGGIIDSLLLEQSSRYYYETLTPSRFLRASYQDLRELLDRHPGIDRMVRLGTTHTLSGILERLVEIQCFSSEEKFRRLLKRSPHILQLVPHKYLANYLGIVPTNFSKLVNSIRI